MGLGEASMPGLWHGIPAHVGDELGVPAPDDVALASSRHAAELSATDANTTATATVKAESRRAI